MIRTPGVAPSVVSSVDTASNTKKNLRPDTSPTATLPSSGEGNEDEGWSSVHVQNHAASAKPK